MAHFPVDLHVHTTASDGTHSPAEIVQRAARRGVKILGIADHDTLAGIPAAQAAGQTHGVTVIPAIEFSTRHDRAKQFVGIHILGYFIDSAAPGLIKIVEQVQQGRLNQKIEQIERLQSFGFDIPVDAVLERVSGVPGRPHIAAVLMERNPGHFDTMQHVFDEYLGAGKKAHVRRSFSLTVGEAIAVIKDAGGLPVFAHPGAYDGVTDPVAAVQNAVAEGLAGVEVFYPYRHGRGAANGTRWIAKMEQLAQVLGLPVTGGTDFHGRPSEPIDVGDMGLTLAQFAALEQAWRNS